MKTQITLSLFAMIAFLLVVAVPGWAIQPVGNTAMAVHAASKKEAHMAKQMERAQKRMERMMARVERIVARKGTAPAQGGIDLQDPVKKWMWFWILGWGGALVLHIISRVVLVGTYGTGFGIAALLGLLGSLLGLFGTVSLVMWIIKMNT